MYIYLKVKTHYIAALGGEGGYIKGERGEVSPTTTEKNKKEITKIY